MVMVLAEALGVPNPVSYHTIELLPVIYERFHDWHKRQGMDSSPWSTSRAVRYCCFKKSALRGGKGGSAKPRSLRQSPSPGPTRAHESSSFPLIPPTVWGTCGICALVTRSGVGPRGVYGLEINR